ncbi:MAG: sigma-54-dependent transcriptional regulator [Phycisphaerae bacterium]
MSERVHQNVLVVHRQCETTRLVLERLAARGLRGAVEADASVAADKVAQGRWDLVLVAPEAVGEKAFDLLSGVKESFPELPVVMLGKRDDTHLAVRALRNGCDDYLIEPATSEAIEDMLDSLLPSHAVSNAAAAEDGNRRLLQIAGRSDALRRTLELARKVAPTSIPVLITGESGTGKELVSYFVHRQSQRRRGPYIRVNCAAVTESLLESELFGHERGAFTGAYSQRKGRFERAHGGTLLLDEISETTPRLQAELLRVLEQQDFERVGGTEPVCVNVRVISTSNRELSAETRAGRFRHDLFYRLSGVHLVVPPLRQRPEDIPVLTWHFVNLYAHEVRRCIRELDEQMLKLFEQYSWPGNVRQLRNVVRTALVLGEGETLSLDGAPWLAAEMRRCDSPNLDAESLRLQELERQAIFEALRRTKRNQTKAARLLGITDRTLREKLRRYRQDGYAVPTGGGK